jgi:ribosomal protein L36
MKFVLSSNSFIQYIHTIKMLHTSCNLVRRYHRGYVTEATMRVWYQGGYHRDFT